MSNLQNDPRWSALMTELGKSPEQLEQIVFDPGIPD